MNLLTNVFLVSALHGAFLIVVIASRSRLKINANTFLIILLAIISGYVYREYLYLQDRFDEFPHLMAFFVPWLYLVGPLYLFYVHFSLEPRTKLYYRDLLHLVPAFICFLTILPFYLLSGDEKLALYDAPGPGNLELATNRIFYYGLMLLSWFYYGFRAYQLIQSKNYKKANLIWLKRYTELFLFFLVVFLLAQLVFVFTDFYPYYVMLGTILASSLLVHFVGYWALRESKITRIGSYEPGIQLSEDKVDTLKADLLNLLEVQKVYVNNQLTIDSLAHELSTNSKYLSQLINQEFGCSWTYLINSYRVDEAKHLIRDSNYEHLNFLGIGFQVGFNTKNTFTRVFKRHTGRTPSQFKKESE